jgi:hypothetical protein
MLAVYHVARVSVAARRWLPQPHSTSKMDRATDADLANKMANTINASARLRKTYTPVNIASARRADEARRISPLKGSKGSVASCKPKFTAAYRTAERREYGHRLFGAPRQSSKEGLKRASLAAVSTRPCVN